MEKTRGQYEMGRTWTTSTTLVNQSYPAAAHHLAFISCGLSLFSFVWGDSVTTKK